MARRPSRRSPFSSPFTGKNPSPYTFFTTLSSRASSYQPSPFFVLDEVDAALDNTNVAKIANYIRSHASESFQFIVISLKGSLYERSNSLVGIFRDQEVNSSRTLTLDVRLPPLCNERYVDAKYAHTVDAIRRINMSMRDYSILRFSCLAFSLFFVALDPRISCREGGVRTLL